jgi:Complex 1 protein (LYR family)
MNGGSVRSNTVQRTAKQLYRDCLRLIHHVAPGMFTNSKAVALRSMVRTEFKKNIHLTNPDAIDVCKGNAIRALSNYFVLKSIRNDQKVQAAATDYHHRSVQAAANDTVDTEPSVTVSHHDNHITSAEPYK